jgi:hypothetical protein
VSQIVIVASSVSSVVIDGVKWAPADSAHPPIDPPPVHPPSIPPGNQGAILPPIPWPTGQASSDLYQVPPNPVTPNGLIICYELPPLHGGQGVTFTQGQNTSSQPCVTEFSVSQTPGEIIPGQGAYYYISENIAYNVMTVWRVGSTMPLAPEGQTWYFNIRWQNKTNLPNSFSRQWSASAQA